MATSLDGILMGMGNPLLDICVDAPQSLLDKYEVVLDNQILAEEKHLPMYDEIIKEPFTPLYVAGGATQNSIRVAQWMLTSAGIPNATAFTGCVGDDSFGKQLEDCATSDGVKTFYLKDTETPTGTCAALVKDGERSLIANLAAANKFQKSHLESDSSKAIYEKAKFFYIAGFFLTVSVESLVLIGDHAVENDKVFAFNLSAPFIIDFFGDQVATALPYADYLFCNEGEAAAYAKKHSLGDDLKDVALKISAMEKKNAKRNRVVVFTQGSLSTIVATEGKVSEYPVEPLAKEKLVDTNGAGDAFVGGFLSQIVQGKSIEDAVKAGHYSAKYIIQQSGCTLDKCCDYK